MSSSTMTNVDIGCSSQPQVPIIEEESENQQSIVHGKSSKTIQQIRSRRLKILATLLVAVGAAIVCLIVVINTSGNKSGGGGGVSDSAAPIDTTSPTEPQQKEQGVGIPEELVPQDEDEPEEVVRPHVPAAIQVELLGKHYITSRDVTSELSLALDAADMRALNSTDTEGQMKIYLNGSRSFTHDASGKRIRRNLADLSLKAGQNFKQDPLYHIFLQAFLEVGEHEAHEHFGDFDDKPVQEYANTLVMDLFAIRRSKYIEVEAALVLNVWMAIMHELNEVLRSCQRRDDQEFLHSSLDRAAALWVGNNQEFGDNNSGNMLYNFAERAGERFGQDSMESNGETKANQVIMQTFKEIQDMINANKCSGNDAGEVEYLEVREAVDTLVKYMTVPLVQELIHTIIENQGDWTELYALSFLPRIASCNPELYDTLMGFLVLRDLQEEDKAEALNTIQYVMGECLHITCDMLGTYQDTTSGNWFPVDPSANVTSSIVYTPCEGPNFNKVVPPKVLAGYPLSENINELAHIDNDILQIRILMEAQAYDAALDYYLHGQNSRPGGRWLTLRELAASEDRKYAPQFELFADYYGSNNYAHEIVIKAMNRAAPFDKASAAQLTEVVVVTLQAMVMYVAVLQHLYIAVETCKDDKFIQSPNDETKPVFGLNDYTDGHVKIWDVGAAFYIGSLEGNEEEGDTKGQLLFNAASDFCTTFGTCANIVYSRVNKRIVGALVDGKNALSLDECDEAESILTDEIVPQLLVPLVQGTLFYANQNKDLPAGTGDRGVGAGYAFSRSILPFVRAEDPSKDQSLLSASEVVDTNLDISQTTKPVADGVSTVFDALGSTVLNGESGVVVPMVFSRHKANITLSSS